MKYSKIAYCGESGWVIFEVYGIRQSKYTAQASARLGPGLQMSLYSSSPSHCVVTATFTWQVFEDTKHLVQSAVDGFNVCIFAYGQTGSGKTFTIYGSEANPGITPRGIQELFKILQRDSHKYSFNVSTYMLELYQDELTDLLVPAPPKGSQKVSWLSCLAVVTSAIFPFKGVQPCSKRLSLMNACKFPIL